MPYPVAVRQENGRYVATLLGAPELRAEGATREAALAQLQALLQERVARGELVSMEVEPKSGVLAIAGKYRDDPTLAEMCAEIYRERDAEPKE